MSTNLLPNFNCHACMFLRTIFFQTHAGKAALLPNIPAPDVSLPYHAMLSARPMPCLPPIDSFPYLEPTHLQTRNKILACHRHNTSPEEDVTHQRLTIVVCCCCCYNSRSGRTIFQRYPISLLLPLLHPFFLLGARADSCRF